MTNNFNSRILSYDLMSPRSQLAILVILMFILGSSSNSQFVSSSQVKKHQGAKLVIGTRHDSIIYTRFAEAFVASSYAADVGITDVNDITWFSPTTYDAFKRVMTLDEIGADLGWGGGPTLFNTLALDGAIEPITDTETLAAINAAVPDQIAGADMKKFDADNQLIWAANAISSFGFTVNHDTLDARGLETPRTWEDLASPDFFTGLSEFNVGLGNAPDTTSNTRIYQILIQKFGWERAWEIIYQMAGNGKIYGGSVETRASVISGETAAAMTIDFYGVIAMQENPRTEYVVPANASIVNGDPIAMAKSPSNPEAAKAFMEFVFSQEGQAIWVEPRINRLPVRIDAFNTTTGQSRPDIKELYESTIANQGIQFDEDLALSFEEPMRFHFESTITNVHSRLRTSWSNMVNARNNGNITEAKFEELRQRLTEPAMTQDEAAAMKDDFISDQAFRRQKEDEWFEHASTKFDDLESEFTVLGIEDTNVKDVPLQFNVILFGLVFVAIYANYSKKSKYKL